MTRDVDPGLGIAVLGILIAIALISDGGWRRLHQAGRGIRTRFNQGLVWSRIADFLDVAVLSVGIGLMVSALVVGLTQLHIRQAPVGETKMIGFVPPNLEPAIRGRGTVLGMSVHVKGCDKPVAVKLVAGGTAEYWRDNRRYLPARPEFRLAIPDENVRRVRLGTGSSPDYLTGPLYAEPMNNPPLLTQLPTRRGNELTVVSGTVRDWPNSLASVVATFEADWLEHRAIGSCYLQLPGIAGPDAIFPAQQALARVSKSKAEVEALATKVGADLTARNARTGVWYPYLPGLAPNEASATVAVDSGSVLADASQPSPDTEFDGHPKWTCEWTPPESAPLGRVGSVPGLARGSGSNAVGTYSREALSEGHHSSCAAVAVINEDSAAAKRDLVLLLMGSAISLGAAVLVEVLLDWRKSGVPWRRRRARRTTPP